MGCYESVISTSEVTCSQSPWYLIFGDTMRKVQGQGVRPVSRPSCWCCDYQALQNQVLRFYKEDPPGAGWGLILLFLAILVICIPSP